LQTPFPPKGMMLYRLPIINCGGHRDLRS